ncbi:pyridoxamine 5'-phosphate oxidase family protein [Intrasporangium sp.]|uniref:pyridoxamine 5'-phosphate oxidase family protein n=1 Tax=Intrasporangium sp. TaxID=1925024 RepID=UPI00293A9520|nr:pyridoxamine 5'-phosphate oxidase family protein [Intrasporangium sp.]MDV3222160.1 pyridoxamine 5'-phosphate oxidase family protein [Intrasporangium sp.]
MTDPTSPTGAARLTTADREFLDGPRLGFLSFGRPRAWGQPVPVWFESTDEGVHLFTETASRKVARVTAGDWASLVAANEVGEPEHWVAISGPARLETTGAGELATRLGARYWDLTDPRLRAVVDSWRTADLVRIVVPAARVRRYG